MIRLLPLLLAAITAPASAQHSTHDHAGHGSSPSAQADPHARHRVEPAPDKPKASAAPTDHASHETTPTPPSAPPPPEAMIGPEHAADRVFGAAAMDESRRTLIDEHGGMSASKLLIDRLEWQAGNGRDTYLLDAEGWFGGDIDKVWIKLEAEGEHGRRAEVQGQALWSHAVDPWFDLQAGLRHDLRIGPDRTHLVLGIQGLAPYWWEVDGAVFLSSKGELTARGEAEYDLRLTQELILQPRVELDLSAQKVPALGIGPGLTSANAGVRLRYQLTPTFAPYLGVQAERAFGETRRLRRNAGEDVGGMAWVIGLRSWF